MWLTTSSLVLYQLVFVNSPGCKTLHILSITLKGKLRFVLQLDLVESLTGKKIALLERKTKDLLKNALLMMQNHMIVENLSALAVLLYLL